MGLKGEIMSVYDPSPATLAKLAKRQHNKGAAPCGECNLNKHNCCRPRLDGTFCTCSCARAEAIRRAATDDDFLNGFLKIQMRYLLEARQLYLGFKRES